MPKVADSLRCKMLIWVELEKNSLTTDGHVLLCQVCDKVCQSATENYA